VIWVNALRVPRWGWVLGCLGGVLADCVPERVNASAAACSSDMVLVQTVNARFCIDRYEAAAKDKKTGELLSPYYPPEATMLSRVYLLWENLRRSVGDDSVRGMPLPTISPLQKGGAYTPRATSEPGLVPQAYVSYYSAKRMCETANKRLCTEQEWTIACRGERNTQFPYGPVYQAGRCNVGSYQHPAAILHGLSSSGHLDPRLNLLMVGADAPVLRETGGTPTCASRWGGDAVFDMVGNLDEWVEHEKGVFKGAFYARGSKSGCDAVVGNHSHTYFDYSTGARCCRDVGP
jgi:formylglycine-generating enzyme